MPILFIKRNEKLWKQGRRSSKYGICHTYTKLIASGYDLANVISIENGLIQFNSQAFLENAKAKLAVDIVDKKLEKAELEEKLAKETAMAMANGAAYQYLGASINAARNAINGINTEIFDMEQALAMLNNWQPPEIKEKGDPYKDSVESKIKDIQYDRDKGLISEEEYLNRLRTLNEKYYKDKTKYLDDYRKYELEVINGLQKISEQKLEFTLSYAEDTQDYNKQLEVYRQYQENAHALANEFRKRGYAETDIEITEQQKKYREASNQIIDIYEKMFQSQKNVFDRKYSSLEFKLSLTADDDYEAKETLINEQIENRLALSKELIDEMVKLQLTTDDNTKTTQKFKDVMESLDTAYDSNVKSVYDLIKAQKDLAEQQISSVKDLQDKIVDMLKARYDKEAELLKKKYDDEKNAIDKQKELIKEKYDSEVKMLDETLKQMKKVWDEEDRRKKKQQNDEDVNEIQKRINELTLAADSGDAEAISMIEDLQKKLKDKQSQIRDDEEKYRRQAIEDAYSDQKEALKDKYDLDTKNLENEAKL